MSTGVNGWTGGQYSLFRLALGSVLALRFVQTLPALAYAPRLDAIPGFPNLLVALRGGPGGRLLLAAGCLAALMLALGALDRVAAVVAAYVWFCTVDIGLKPLAPAVVVLGVLPLLHLGLPAAPYGSLARRGRTDPGAGWRMPDAVHVAAWILLVLLFATGGATKLFDPGWTDGSALTARIERAWWPIRQLGAPLIALPWAAAGVAWIVGLLELGAALPAVIRRVRPHLWTVLVVLQLIALLLDGYVGLRAGVLLLLALTFDPRWVPDRGGPLTERLFYDGSCGLCHRIVRLMISEDPQGRAFRLAPLQGETFRKVVPQTQRERLPDSMVLVRSDGVVLTRSACARHVGKRLGGIWGVAASLASILPTVVADRIYDLIARVRSRLFRRPEQLCPVLPPELAGRFED